MKKQKKGTKSNNQSKSFVLPSSDEEDERLSDKGIDSFREHRISQAPKRPVIPNLNLKSPKLENAKQQKGIIEPLSSLQRNDSDLDSPILSSHLEQRIHQNLTQDQDRFRKAETQKTAPQSIQKSNFSPERNPQSIFSQYNNSTGFQPSEEMKGKDNGQVQQPMSGSFIKQSSNESQQRQIQPQSIPNNNQLYYNDRGPSLESNEEIANNKVEPKDSNKTTNQKRGIFKGRIHPVITKPTAPFNDSIVSAIQKTDNQAYLEDGSDDLNDEDNSARRLMTADQFQNPSIPLHRNAREVQEDSREALGASPQQTFSNYTIGQSKELINLIDQSKEDFLGGQPFPIVHNRMQSNANQIQIVDYKHQSLSPNRGGSKQGSESGSRPQSSKRSGRKQMTGNFRLNSNEAIVRRRQNRYELSKKNTGMTRGNTQEVDNNELEFDIQAEEEDIEFKQFGLDTSILENQLKMPTVQGNKVQLQNEIGHFIQIDTVEAYHQHEQEHEQHNDSFYRVVNKDSIEIIEQYHDKCPLLDFRKNAMKIRVYIVRIAYYVITHTIFESISISVIVANCFFLALDDPTSTTPNPVMDISDYVFQGLYTTEMLLKIFGLGFIWNKGSYLRDTWNILDFVIVVSGYATFFLDSSSSSGGSSTNISALRSFRVLRPLRTISGVEGLRVIVTALIRSLPLLRDTILVLMFFFFIFAIAGLQLFQGVMKNRCVSEETGVAIIGDDKSAICGGGAACPDGYFCGKTNTNPKYGVYNFDNILYSVLQVFCVVTLEGWSFTMLSLWNAVASWVVIYFIPIVFIGTWFLLNLTLAVIKSQFTEEHKKQKRHKAANKGKGKKKAVAGVQDEEEGFDDEGNDDQGGGKPKAIEGQEDLSPAQKRNRREKARVDKLLKRVDMAIRQKEIHDKLTPRGSLQNSGIEAPVKETIMSMFLKPNLFVNKPIKRSQSQDDKETPAPVVAVAVAISNYGDIFNKKLGNNHEQVVDSFLSPQGRTSNPSRSDMKGFSGQLSIERSSLGQKIRQRNSNSQVNMKEGSAQDGPLSGRDEQQEAKKNENSKATKDMIMSKMMQNKPRAFKEEKQKTFAKERFELKNFCSERPVTQGKMLMRGIADIHSRFSDGKNNSNGGSPIRERPSKKDIYDKIIQKLNIFEFFDMEQNEEADASGNSEQSVDPQDSLSSTQRENRMRDTQQRRLDLEDVDDLIDPDNHRHKGVLGRKTTVDSNENKSFSQKRDDIISPGFNLRSSGNTQSMFRKSNPLRRLNTFTDQHGAYKHVDTDTIIKKVLKKTFKQKAKDIFKKSKKGEKLAVKIDIVKLSRSLPRPSIDFKAMGHNTVAPQPQQSNQPSTPNGNLSRSVKGKSDDRKKFHMLQEKLKFKVREKYIKRKRNKFFAPAIRNIGKTKDELRKEKNDKVTKKRILVLGGGFEIHNADTFLKKKTLLRSASSLGLQSKRKKQVPDLNNSFLSDELIKDIEKLRKKKEIKIKAEEQEDHVNDSSLDMEQILKKTKKKIVLKNKTYNFSSTKDVLQLRGKTHFETKITPEILNDGKHPVGNPAEEQKDGKKKDLKTKKVMNKHLFKAYQKKITYDQKQNFEDLVMEEARESDDNQETVLNRIENEYNVAHRSNIHVTGTLSIVINEHQNFKKIMNNNYFANLRSQTSIKSSSSLQGNQGPFQISRDGNSVIREESNVSVVSAMERAKSMDSSKYLGSALRRGYTRGAGGAGGISPMPLGSALKRGRFVSPQFKSFKTQGQANESKKFMSSNNFTGSHHRVPIMRPEVLTDKQILKRLNKEFTKSVIFNSVKHHTKLPVQIMRDKVEENTAAKKPNKKAKNKKQPNKQGLGNDKGEEDDTFSSEDFQADNEPDFFLDREMICLDEVKKAKAQAIGKPKDNIEWSGQDIMTRFDPYKARIALNSLNNIRVWPTGFYGYVKRGRVLLKNIMRSSAIEHFLILAVACNTVVLALDHYGISEGATAILQLFNKIFTVVFCLEMFLKIIAIGIVKYLGDKMNYLDGSVVLLSLVEAVFLRGSGGALSAFRSIRMFRTFRVLRVARLLRSMKSMMNILSVISRSLSSFVYLAILLFLFIFIYALLGMQLFGGQMNFDEDPPRNNFDSFTQAFVTSFIILTMENWNATMVYMMRSGVHFLIVQLYCISWIFIGNYMLLNLFLSILLDAFTSVEEEDHETTEKKLEREKQKKEDLMKKTGEEMITQMNVMQTSNMQGTTGGASANKKKKKKKKKSSKLEDNNILDESIELDMETLAIKKEEQKKVKEPFQNIFCENAFFFFTKKNPIRLFCYNITTHGKFETGILLLIVTSSIKLVYDTYLLNVDETALRVIISNKLDYVFTVFFTLEALTKSISLGLLFDKNSYLRETWNQLDFFIVVTSLIDISFTNVNLPIIKVLRLLRILRPLRFISHNSSMKTVVVALLQSMGPILNVGIVVCLVYLMFAILAVNLFGGKLQYCDVNTYHVRNKRECTIQDGKWHTYKQNFDNVPNAMITLFVIANQEGWPDIMNTVVDGRGVDMGPAQDANPLAAYFFVVYIFIGSFFFMNLFVGVIFMNFEAAQRDERESLLLESHEVKWVDMMRMIVNTKPEILKLPKNKFSQWVYEFTKPETKFDFTIMICIILNMLTMAMNYEDQPHAYTKALEYINYFFTSVFAVEATLKMIGQGISYFSQTWNKFDLFVVCASFIDIAMGQLSGNSLKFLRVGPQLARVLRVLRVSRLFRLLNKYRGLQALIQTIMFSLPSLLNVLALLMLVFFIYAVLGVYLFGNITDGVIIDDQVNFKNFGLAMLILFRMVTGEDWPTIMYDTMNTSPDCIKGKTCGTSISPLYFISLQMVCVYVMLNLFILIILQQFELYYLPDDNILQKFRDDLTFFKETWNMFSKEFEGIKIKSNDLVAFFKELKGELAFKGENEKGILRNIVKMSLEADEEGFIYFNELLFKAMKRIYGEERTKKKVLAEIEFKYLEKLQQIKEKMLMKSRKQDRIKAVSVNPFLTVMYKSMSFKAWFKIYRQNLDKRQDEINFGIDRDSSDEELEAINSHNGHQDDEDYEYVVLEDVTIIEEVEEEEDNKEQVSGEDEEQFVSDQTPLNHPKGSLEKLNEIDEEEGFTIKLRQTLRGTSKDNLLSNSPVTNRNQEAIDYFKDETEKEEDPNQYSSTQPINQ